MPSDSQNEFFKKLIEEKQLPDNISKSEVETQFAQLGKESASAWIERLLELPEKGKEQIVPPSF